MKTLIETTICKTNGHKVRLKVTAGSHNYIPYFRVLQEVDDDCVYFYPNTYEQALKTYRQLFDFHTL